MQKVLRLLALVLILSSVLTSAPSSVEAATKKAKLNMRKLDMTVGDSFQLRVYNMKKKQKAVYVSTDSNILSVDSVNASSKRATITAVAIGSANINVTIKKGRRVVKQLKCRVKISPNAVSIKFPKKTVKLQPTEQFQLDPIIKPITSTEQPVFESDDTSVATVSSRGTVTALSPGIVTITATLLSTNQTAECKIIVSEPNETTEKPEQNEKKRSLDNLFFSC
jgi:uncharacterized protein YjdB